MGFDLAYSLERSTPLSAEELDVLAKHLRHWRRKIVNYDWQVPGDPAAAPAGLIAWGGLRPTRGKPDVSDEGGYLGDVIDKVHEALAKVRDLVPDATLAFADDFGAFAWTAIGFDYRNDAPYPRRPADVAAWVSLAARDIPTKSAAKARTAHAARPVSRAEVTATLASADRAKLVEIVLAPRDRKITDRERTAAVELLASDPVPEVLAVFVERLRLDGTERAWTPAVMRTLAAGPRRCSWATGLLAFDQRLPGAAALVFATVDDEVIPHLARLPTTERWNALVVQALDVLDSDAARDAQRERIDRVFEAWLAARLAVVTSVLAARRAADARAGLQQVANALTAIGEHADWLAYADNAGAKALAAITDERVTQRTIDDGLAAIAAFALEANDFMQIYADQRKELYAIEGAWVQRLRPPAS